MKLKKLISLIMVIVMLSLTLLTTLEIPVNAATGDVYQVTLNVTYGQTEARGMLDAINQFRTGSEAWYWNSDNTTKTTLTSLNELEYSYDLEQIAMKRAVEIAIHFDHTRPNGESCWSCKAENGVSSNAENIAIGQRDANAVFVSWREDNEDYSGQGHRRNMLGSYNAVGIGHVYYNYRHYWVQEFGYSVGNVTTANDSNASAEIDVAKSFVTSITKTRSTNNITLEYESNTEIPTINAGIKTVETWPNIEMPTTLKTNWTIENTNIARIEAGKIVAASVGKTNIKTIVDGETISIPITVTEKSLSTAVIELPEVEYEYDKTEKKPTPTVKLAGVTIASNNYDVTYKNNTNVGTATVTITGKGNYKDSVSKDFEIICKHTNTELKNVSSATCKTPGYTGDKYCSLCDTLIEKGSVIPTTDHVPETDYQKDDECHKKECIGCGIVVVKENHQYGDTYTTDDTNHSKTCTVCNYVHSEAHTGGIATCVNKKVCSVCNKEYGNVNLSNHLNTEIRGQKTPTCQAEGNTGDTYCKDCNTLIKAGTVLSKTDHTGGVATCSAKARCIACNQEYGELDANNHVNTVAEGRIEATCTTDGVSGRVSCKDCQKVITEGTVIPAKRHTGGTATCSAKAVCTTCKQEYGELNNNNHVNTVLQGKVDVTCTTDGNTGNKYCNDCKKIIEAGTVIPAKGHTGGTATCSAKAVCTTCNQEYGELNNNNHVNTVTTGKVDATCTTDGATGEVYCNDCNKTVSSNKVIPAKGHTNGKPVIENEVEATVSAEGRYEEVIYCSECKIELSRVEKITPKFVYEILEGAFSSHEEKTDGTITIRANGKFEKFQGIKIDNEIVDKKHYTAKSGSTVVTLNADYLNSLAIGEHKIAFVYDDGEIETTFKIAEKNTTQDNDNNIKKGSNKPKTGDDSKLALWVTIAIISSMSMIMIVKCQKRKTRKVRKH